MGLIRHKRSWNWKYIFGLVACLTACAFLAQLLLDPKNICEFPSLRQQAIEEGLFRIHSILQTVNETEPSNVNTVPESVPKGCIPRHELPEPFRQGEMKEYQSLLGKGHPAYIRNLRNPCWYEELTTSSTYHGQYFYEHLIPHSHPLSEFLELQDVWAARLKAGPACRLRCLPYFYLIGVAKSGTTDLFGNLRTHPYLATLRHNEIHWWTRSRMADNQDINHIDKNCKDKDKCKFQEGFSSPIEFYADLFDKPAQELEHYVSKGELQEHVPQKIIGEGTPSTLIYSVGWWQLPENQGLDAPKFHNGHYIREVTPDARLIVIMRNPTARLYSWYNFRMVGSATRFHDLCTAAVSKMKQCISERPLWNCVNDITIDNFLHLRFSMYYPFIKEWLKVFPREQFFFTRLEDYGSNRIGVLNDIGEFLSIGPFPDNMTEKIMGGNPKLSGHDRPEPMLNETKKLLDDFFKPYNKMLAALLKDDKYLFQD